MEGLFSTGPTPSSFDPNSKCLEQVTSIFRHVVGFSDLRFSGLSGFRFRSWRVLRVVCMAHGTWHVARGTWRMAGGKRRMGRVWHAARI